MEYSWHSNDYATFISLVGDYNAIIIRTCSLFATGLDPSNANNWHLVFVWGIIIHIKWIVRNKCNYYLWQVHMSSCQKGKGCKLWVQRYFSYVWNDSLWYYNKWGVDLGPSSVLDSGPYNHEKSQENDILNLQFKKGTDGRWLPSRRGFIFLIFFLSFWGIFLKYHIVIGFVDFFWDHYNQLWLKCPCTKSSFFMQNTHE